MCLQCYLLAWNKTYAAIRHHTPTHTHTHTHTHKVKNLNTLKSHFLPLDKPKIRLCWGRESDVSCGRQALGTNYFSSWPAQNAKWVKSRKRCFKGSHVTLNSFSAFYHSKMGLRCGRESVVPRVRMAFSTYFRSLDQPKIRLGWYQKNEFSSGCKALWTHFQLHDQPKMRFEWSRNSNDSSCRMSLWRYFLLLEKPKMRYFHFDKATIQGVEWHLK